jgi:hypothetical protein
MFYKKLTLLDAIYKITRAWDMVKPTTISKSKPKTFAEYEINK